VNLMMMASVISQEKRVKRMAVIVDDVANDQTQRDVHGR
jgi:polysaccharide deacetylase 2 family uncharacterized protein YibQ